MKIQEAIKYIKKYAQVTNGEPPEMPPRVHIKTTRTGVGAVKSVSSSVVEMQQAMVALANENYQAPPTGQPIDMGQYQKNKDFEDFMVESYSSGSNIKGEEWNPSVAFHTPGTRRPSDLIELSNVFNQLKKINSVNNPIKPDGRWGFRTQNGIKNIWAFADALIRVYEDFDSNLQNPEFTKQDLSQLSKKIPKTSEGADADVEKEIKKYSASDLDERAKVITPLVNKLTLFYRRFKKSILQNPIYKQFVESDDEGKYSKFPIKMNSSPAEQFNPDLLKQIDIKNLKNVNISGQFTFEGGKPVEGKVSPLLFGNIPVSFLKDERSFEEFLIKWLGFSREAAHNNQELRLNVIKEIKNHIDSSLAKGSN